MIITYSIPEVGQIIPFKISVIIAFIDRRSNICFFNLMEKVLFSIHSLMQSAKSFAVFRFVSLVLLVLCYLFPPEKVNLIQKIEFVLN